MRVVFTPLSDSLIPACKAFNERMLAYGTMPFPLPEVMSRCDVSGGGTHFVGVDDTGAVRGGVLLLEQFGWLNGKVVSLINIQSPLSEGLIDRKFSGVGLQMLKFITNRSPYSYAVGMGSEQSAFARLLRAGGWSVSPVPFEFDVINAPRFLSEIRALRRWNMRLLARTAAVFGLGSLAMAVWRLSHPRASLRGYSLELTTSWPSEAGKLWERFRAEITFSALREETGLAALYPDTQPRLKRFVLRYGEEIVGWSVGLVTKMNHDLNFGDLVVGTVLDGLALEGHLPALIALTRDALTGMGAEVIVMNQTHCHWRTELRRLGFFNSATNYLLALSKALVTELGPDGSVLERIHVNRGDGDGRLHL